jgi:hypothetical protein
MPDLLGPLVVLVSDVNSSSIFITYKLYTIPEETVLGSCPGEDAYIARKLRTIEGRRWNQSYLFRRTGYRIKGHNPENLSWVRVPVKTVPVARKLSTIERRQNQSCLFRRSNLMNIDHNPENLSWAQVPVKMISAGRN